MTTQKLIVIAFGDLRERSSYNAVKSFLGRCKDGNTVLDPMAALVTSHSKALEDEILAICKPDFDQDPLEEKLLYFLNNQDTPAAKRVRDLVKQKRFPLSDTLVEALLSGQVSNDDAEITTIFRHYAELQRKGEARRLRGDWRVFAWYFRRMPLLREPSDELVTLYTEVSSINILPREYAWEHFFQYIPRKNFQAFLRGYETASPSATQLHRAYKTSPIEIAVEYCPDLRLKEYARCRGLMLWQENSKTLSALLSERGLDYEYRDVFPEALAFLGENPPIGALLAVLKGLV